MALTLAFTGCVLVARAYDPAELRFNGLGLVLGLGAGLTYALYTILSKIALRNHSNGTALTFALVFGTLFLLPWQSPDGLAPLTQGGMAWLLLLGLAIGPTLGSLTLYNLGLREVPASNASLIAMLEPVVASILAFVFLGEQMELLQSIGGVMVVVGAVLVK
jgi:drug/metabolite transporter (DMT)-like permease